MRVGVDATSLLGPRSGVGHSTASLVEALLDVDDDIELALLPISVRGARRLSRVAPSHPRVTVLRTPIPARLAGWVWSRTSWPPVELFCGRLDVFWGPNFSMPPLLKAAGVVSVHDLGFARMPETASAHTKTYAPMLSTWVSRAKLVVVPSAFTASELTDVHPETSGRTRVVSQGVRRDFLDAGGPLSEPRRNDLGIRGPYACYVGNLEARKDVGSLLESFEVVRHKHPDAQLVLVGSPGVDWDRTEARHASLLASGAVVRTGYLPDPEVAAIVRGASVFVYPSLYEGFGMPPVEAMAAGTPAVVSDLPVHREVLGPHATYVATGDIGGFAAAIAAALEDRPRPDDVEAARRHARAYDWKESARALADVFREAAGG